MPSREDRQPNPLTLFAEQWLKLCQQAVALGRGGLAAAASFPDTRPLRNLWLATLSQTMDRYLRSPAFLQLMEHSVKVMAKTTGPTLTRPGAKP